MSTVAAVAKPLSPAVPDSVKASSSRPRRAPQRPRGPRVTQREAKTSPASTNGSNVSGGSGSSHISRSNSGNLASPDKPSGSASIPLPSKISPDGSVASPSGRTSPPAHHPIKVRLQTRLQAGVWRERERSRQGEADDSSEASEADLGFSEDDDPEVIPAKKIRRFRIARRSPSPPASVPPPAVKTEASTTTSTPRIKFINISRPRSPSPFQRASSTPAPILNGTDAAPTPSSLAMEEGAMTREDTQAVEDEQQAEAVISLDADAEEISKIPDLPRRAPRKKRKWLKKGEVDPDDPVAVARQKERHAIIDEAIANLDAQEAAVRSGEHPQLVSMWKELEQRRYLQLARLQERLMAQKEDLVNMYVHDENQAWENWDEVKEELVNDLTHESWQKASELHAEHIALKRLPNSLPSLRDGRGSGGWQLPNAVLSNGKLGTVAVRTFDGELRERKAVTSRPDQLSYSELTSDLIALGIKGEITGRLKDVAPPKTRLTKAQEEKKAESRRRTRAFSPPPPEPRPRMTSERFKTIGDAFNEHAGPFDPLPLDQFGKPNIGNEIYEGQPCPNPRLPVDVKKEAATGTVKAEAQEKETNKIVTPATLAVKA